MSELPAGALIRPTPDDPDAWPILQCKNVFVLPGVPSGAMHCLPYAWAGASDLLPLPPTISSGAPMRSARRLHQPLVR